MIKPAIGRVVLVYQGTLHQGSQWNVAQVCYVHSDELINVAGFDAGGSPFVLCSLTLRQDPVAEDPVYIPAQMKGSVVPFACWIPYQRKQAEKDTPTYRTNEYPSGASSQ